MQIGKTDPIVQKELNTMAPAARDAHLGDVLYGLLATVNDLVTKNAALLAHLDTANVTGIGNANAATFGSATGTITLPAER